SPATGAGRLAAQVLLLGMVAGLAGVSLAHPGGLALCVLASLFAIRKGPIWPTPAAGPSAGTEATS
ncbi:MAG: hypothetical protein JKY65_26060, partial [Planctomycetes bacterium]|nr:hypothetical protein [Planctomycetota bacterium]